MVEDLMIILGQCSPVLSKLVSCDSHFIIILLFIPLTYEVCGGI